MPAKTVDYNTHILIGLQSTGSMTVLCDWSHVPRQSEVQDQIDKVRHTYNRFLLCTPTSILPPPGESAQRSPYWR